MDAEDENDQAFIRKFILICLTSITSSRRKTFNRPQWNSARATDVLSVNAYPNHVCAMDFWNAPTAATNETVPQSRDNTRLIRQYDDVNAIYTSNTDTDR